MLISGTIPSKKPSEKQQIFVNRFGYRFTLLTLSIRSIYAILIPSHLVRQIGENCEAMATPLQNCIIVEGAIKILNDEIKILESDQRTAKTDEMKISLGGQITAKIGLLTVEKQRLLQLEQQGKFHHIFPLLFPHPLDVTHCPITLDISSSPILVMQIRKVRVDGYYCSVVVQCSRKRVSRTNNPSYVIRSISCCFHPNR